MINDRIEAGTVLAKKLLKNNIKDPIVLAIPRGGIVVGNEIAKRLDCKLDVVISKKITPQDSPEFAIGAITYDGTLYKGEYWNYYTDESFTEEEIEKKKTEVKRRLELYRGNYDYNLQGKTVILVDDGIATGATVFALLNWLKKQNTKEIILAVPVMPASIYETMKRQVSQIEYIEIPVDFAAVGQFYRKFDQVSDEEIIRILGSTRRTH
jgi:predicted phosphoribosyltransferase